MGMRLLGPARLVLIGASVLAVLGSAVVGPLPVSAQSTAAFCQPGQVPQFSGGFATLYNVIPDQMGSPVECEHAIDTLGNTQQKTTTGLAYYVKIINLAVFTNGTDHWSVNNDGLLDWTGDSPYPPGMAPPPLGSSKDYAIPMNTPGDLGDGWAVALLSVTPNATAQVLATSNTNFQPAPGTQYFLAQISATYSGATSRRFDQYRLVLTGASGTPFTSYENTCGVIPNALPPAPVQPGSSITGNVCWDVTSSDVPSLILYDEVLLLAKQKYLYFAVH